MVLVRIIFHTIGALVFMRLKNILKSILPNTDRFDFMDKTLEKAKNDTSDILWSKATYARYKSSNYMIREWQNELRKICQFMNRSRFDEASNAAVNEKLRKRVI